MEDFAKLMEISHGVHRPLAQGVNC